MDQSNSHLQLTHPQSTHQRSQRHNIAQCRALDNDQEGLESAADAGALGSHGRQLPHTGAPAVDAMQSNTILQNAQRVTISGNPNFHNIGNVTNVYGGGTDGLQNLNGFISFDAQFDSSAQDPDRQCHPGTRQNVLKRLRDWIDNPNSIERIFWLYGPAGAGKSAIAQTTARSYARPKVAGTFFFFKSDVNRNDGNRLFTTLAYQLAFSIPEIRDHIANSLSERPDIPRTDVETQFNQLLARPFYVLSDDANQQLAPAVHTIHEIVKKYRELVPVIIIDGVDECRDEKLQQRLLKVISDAVKDDRFPLRFLIVSRPEVHIEQTIHRCQSPILTIDLAKLDDANRDIKKYLVDEFARIAYDQGLDPTWPGQKTIDDIVYKSSGNFIFAYLVIRFVGDPYCFAKTQLEIVLNMKPPKTMSPFAILDQLFLEILRRVPDQAFLKRYLALLITRISVSNDYGELSKDDAALMHVSEQELHANLRRMRSLLKFKPVIKVHHRSFLDFLHDASRSSEYHIREQDGIKGYLAVVVDSLVRYVSSAIEQPNPHNGPHFTPRFREMVKWYPPKIELPVEVWQEVTQPLLDLQAKLLQLPNLESTLDFLLCDECAVLRLQRELLQQTIFERRSNVTSVEEVKNLGKRGGVVSSITSKTEKNMNDNALGSLFLSLFARLPETMENCSDDEGVINLMNALLRFDHAETVRRVRSVSDAQKLVDLLDYMIHAKNTLQADARRKASLLALEIFARVPIIPQSYFLNAIEPLPYIWTPKGIPIEVWSQTVLVHRILDRRYILNVRVMPDVRAIHGNDWTIQKWCRQALIPSFVATIGIMLWIAKVVQYFHSMGVVLSQFNSRDVFLDSDFRPKIGCLFSTSRFLLDNQCKEWFSPEDNIFSFGCLFYEVYSGLDIPPEDSISYRRRVITECPSMTEIPEYARQLIQCCCAENPKSRPSIDEVVKEIEGWHSAEDIESGEVVDGMQGRHNVQHLEPSHQGRACTCFGALCSFLSDIGKNWRQ